MPLMSWGVVSGSKPARPAKIVTGVPGRPLSMRIALESNNDKHYDCRVKVPFKQALNLRIINSTIDNTWALINMGSGNQRKHIKSSGGQSVKRTGLVQWKVKQKNLNPLQSARMTVAYRSENCSGIAGVNALLLRSSELNLPVSVVSVRGVDHDVVLIGDERVTSKGLMISDCWAIFGRALKRRDFALGSGLDVRFRYNPSPDPAVLKDLFQTKTVSLYDVNRQYKKYHLAQYTLENDEDFVRAILQNKKETYNHYHSSKNLGIAYYACSDSGREIVVDQSLTERQYTERYYGPSADTRPAILSEDLQSAFTSPLPRKRSEWSESVRESTQTHLSLSVNPPSILPEKRPDFPEQPSVFTSPSPSERIERSELVREHTGPHLKPHANPLSMRRERRSDQPVAAESAPVNPLAETLATAEEPFRPRRTAIPWRESRAERPDTTTGEATPAPPRSSRHSHRSSGLIGTTPPVTRQRRSAAAPLSSRPATSGGEAARSSHHRHHSDTISGERQRPGSRRAMTTATGRSGGRHTRHYSGETVRTAHHTATGSAPRPRERARSMDDHRHTPRRGHRHRHRADRDTEQRRSFLDFVIHKLTPRLTHR